MVERSGDVQQVGEADCVAKAHRPGEADHGAKPTHVRKTKQRMRLWQRILIIIAIVLALAGAAFTVYVNIYYHADGRAQAACASDNSLAVSENADAIVFGNPDTARAGFVFYPGAKVQAEAYAPLMRALAQQGYLCVIEKMPFNLAFFRMDAAQQAMNAYPQVQRWFVGGHSLGGAMASLWLAGNSSAVQGIVFLGSYPAGNLSATNVRGLALYGSNDQVLNRDSYAKSAPLRPRGWTEQIIEGGNHAGFGDYGTQDGDGVAAITPEEQQRIAVDAIAAFMG